MSERVAPFPLVKLGRLMELHNGRDYKEVESLEQTDIPIFGSGGQFSYSEKALHVGEAVLFGRKGTVDKPLYVNGPFWTVDTMFYATSKRGAFPRFLYYVALTLPFKGISTNTALPSITASDLKSLRVPQPGKQAQRAIADYLDRETAQIDELIAKQEHLIVLLFERLEAFRKQQFSAGGQMRSKTVEWFGQVPEQWKWVSLTRYIFPIVDYRGATPQKVEEGIQLVTARNVRKGHIDYSASQEYIDPNSYDLVMRRGLPEINDLLFTMEAPLGNAALVDKKNVAFAQRLIKLRTDQTRLKPQYLLQVILSHPFQSQLQSKATGSTALGIKASKLVELMLPVPSVEEQTEIVEAIVSQEHKSSDLVRKATQMIALLKERRQALISAAVTGKIDVTGRG